MALDINTKKLKKNAFRVSKVQGFEIEDIRLYRQQCVSLRQL